MLLVLDYLFFFLNLIVAWLIVLLGTCDSISDVLSLEMEICLYDPSLFFNKFLAYCCVAIYIFCRFLCLE
jgi:hypothetical protein